MADKTGPKPRINTFGFLDEVGILHSPKHDKVFGLGLLKIHRPNYLHRKIIDYKNSKNFHDEFKFSAITNKNLKLYEGFIDLFFDVKSADFYCTFFDKSTLDIKRFFRGDHNKAYNAFTAKLISDALGVSEYITVIADDIQTPKNDNFEKDVVEKVKTRTRRNALFGICRVESHAVSEIQMTDVLVGAVAYAFKIKYGLITPNKKSAKFRLMKHLQSTINTNSISESMKYRLKYGKKFYVKEFDSETAKKFKK